MARMRDGATKRVMGLDTARCNPGAATAVAGLNFTDPDVLVMVLVVGLGGVRAAGVHRRRTGPAGTGRVKGCALPAAEGRRKAAHPFYIGS
jgi:hypothetical protein